MKNKIENKILFRANKKKTTKKMKIKCNKK